MMKTIIELVDGNAGLLEAMVADIPDDRMCHQPANVPNHPAWQVGYLAFVRANMAKLLGGAGEMPEAWAALFKTGSTPLAERSAYPSKDELLSAFRRLHREAVAALARADAATLAGPHPIVALRGPFPTLGHLVIGLLTMHDGLHLGQISNWRRANGLPRMM